MNLTLTYAEQWMERRKLQDSTNDPEIILGVIKERVKHGGEDERACAYEEDVKFLLGRLK